MSPAGRLGGRPTGPPAWFVEASLGQRVVGALVDGLVFLPFSVALLRGPNAVLMALFLAAQAAYAIGCTAHDGRTLGKRLVGTAALDAVDGSVISVERAVRRWVVLDALPWVLSLVLSPVAAIYQVVLVCSLLPRPLHQGLHDRAAGTLVTSTRPRHVGRRTDDR